MPDKFRAARILTIEAIPSQPRLLQEVERYLRATRRGRWCGALLGVALGVGLGVGGAQRMFVLPMALIGYMLGELAAALQVGGGQLGAAGFGPLLHSKLRLWGRGLVPMWMNVA